MHARIQIRAVVELPFEATPEIAKRGKHTGKKKVDVTWYLRRCLNKLWLPKAPCHLGGLHVKSWEVTRAVPLRGVSLNISSRDVELDELLLEQLKGLLDGQ